MPDARVLDKRNRDRVLQPLIAIAKRLVEQGEYRRDGLLLDEVVEGRDHPASNVGHQDMKDHFPVIVSPVVVYECLEARCGLRKPLDEIRRCHRAVARHGHQHRAPVPFATCGRAAVGTSASSHTPPAASNEQVRAPQLREHVTHGDLGVGRREQGSGPVALDHEGGRPGLVGVDLDFDRPAPDPIDVVVVSRIRPDEPRHLGVRHRRPNSREDKIKDSTGGVHRPPDPLASHDAIMQCRSRSRDRSPLASSVFSSYDIWGVSDDQIQKWADEAEAGYDVDALKRRGRGRPGRGAEPMQVVAVRLTAEELDALDAAAAKQDMTRSEAIRAALAHFAA